MDSFRLTRPFMPPRYLAVSLIQSIYTDWYTADLAMMMGPVPVPFHQKQQKNNGAGLSFCHQFPLDFPFRDHVHSEAEWVPKSIGTQMSLC